MWKNKSGLKKKVLWV